MPGLKHSAALIGDGSEVLGYDDPVSTDHHWGPRVMLFLDVGVLERLAARIGAILSEQLPCEFGGYSTNFTRPDPEDNGTQLLESIEAGPVNHRIEPLSLAGFFRDALAWDCDAALEPGDWLSFPQQRLLGVTAGAVFHDELGLEAIRQRLSFYPHDVWLYQLASCWMRIGQEEHLAGRAWQVGDELGSTLIISRLVRDIMRLCFLMERRYAPYAKWFGTAFAQLGCAATLKPELDAALAAKDWSQREAALCRAYETTAEMHNALELTEPLDSSTRAFHKRPFRVIAGERFADALRDRIEDPAVRRIAERGLIGGIDLISDNTDLLAHARWRESVRALYR